MAIELATAYVTLASSTKGLGKDIVAQYGKAGDAGAKSFGKSMTGGLKGLATGLIAAIGITKIAGFLGGYVSEAIAASDATDKFKQTLKFAGLKTTVIDGLTASTQKYADQTVYSLADIQNTTAQLAANGVPNYDKLAEAAGNLNAVAGGNSETFKAVAMMLTQTAGAGKLTTENWNQLSDAIPGASGMLQEALKKNGAFTGNFRDAMAKGQITAEEFNRALMDLGMTDVAKEAATSTKTIEGAWGNFEAVIVGGLGDMISTAKPLITGFLGVLSTAAESAFTAANGIVKQIVAGLEPLGEAVSVAFGAITGQSEIGEFEGIFKTINDGAIGLRDTFGGLASAVGPALGQIASQVGPILSQLGPGLLTAVQPIVDILPQLLSGFAEAGPALSPMMVVLQAIQPIVPQLATAFTSLGTAVASILSSALASILPVLVQVGTLVTTQLVPALSTLISAILPPLSQLFGVVAQVLGQVLAAVMPLVSSLVGILVPVISQLVTMLAPLIAQLITALAPALQVVGSVVGIVAGILGTVLIPIIQALMPVVTTVFGVVVNIISAALTVVTGIINVFAGLLTGNWDQLWSGLQQIASGTWDLIKSVVIGAVQIVLSVVLGVWNAIKGQTTAIWSAILSAIRTPLQGAVNYVKAAIALISSTISAVWNSVKSTTSSAWAAVKGAVTTGISTVVSVVSGLPGKVTGALSGMVSSLYSVGTNMIQGLINGVQAMAGTVASAARGVVEGAISSAKAALGIHSPSKVFRDIGLFVDQGLVDGLTSGSKKVKSTADSLTKKVINAFDSINKKSTFNPGLGAKNAALSMIKTEGTHLRGIANQREKLADKIKAAGSKLTDAIKLRDDQIKSIKDSMAGLADITKIKGVDDKAVTGTDIIKGLKDTLAGAKSFTSTMAKLRKMGLGDAAYKQLIDQGPEGGLAAATALLKGGSSMVKQVNSLQKQIGAQASSLAKSAGNALYGAGVNAAKGLVNGLKSQDSALAAQAKKLAKSLASEVKKALKIKSPSRVFQEIGQYTGEGLALGIAGSTGVVTAASDKLANAAVIDVPQSSVGGMSSLEGNATALVAALRAALDGARLELDDSGNAFVRTSDLSPLRRMANQGVRTAS